MGGPCMLGWCMYAVPTYTVQSILLYDSLSFALPVFPLKYWFVSLFLRVLFFLPSSFLFSYFYYIYSNFSSKYPYRTHIPSPWSTPKRSKRNQSTSPTFCLELVLIWLSMFDLHCYSRCHSDV